MKRFELYQIIQEEIKLHETHEQDLMIRMLCLAFTRAFEQDKQMMLNDMLYHKYNLQFYIKDLDSCIKSIQEGWEDHSGVDHLIRFIRNDIERIVGNLKTGIRKF